MPTARTWFVAGALPWAAFLVAVSVSPAFASGEASATGFAVCLLASTVLFSFGLRASRPQDGRVLYLLALGLSFLAALVVVLLHAVLP